VLTVVSRLGGDVLCLYNIDSVVIQQFEMSMRKCFVY